jgi:Protein of unknown function (DUF3667)
MGELEGIGDAVTGSLLGRAVEPDTGEVAPDGHTHEKNCLNCGCRLLGDYCHCCGQRAHVHRSLRAFAQDFISGLFNFEGKFWRTLPMLAWRPGEMTRRYIAGERARYISPVALYLFTVFAMFAVLNLTGTFDPVAGQGGLRANVEEALASDQEALVKLEAERKAAVAERKDLTAIDNQIFKRKKDIEESRKFLSGEGLTIGEMDEDTPTWVRPLVEQATENPELLTANIQEAASKFSWLLIPLSVPFLWLLFPLRRRKMYDHTVFVTYSLSFMMMLVIAGGLLVAGGFSALAGFLFFVPPFHMYRHLKGAYELGRFSAIIRTIALVTFAFVAAGLFMATAVALGTFG